VLRSRKTKTPETSHEETDRALCGDDLGGEMKRWATVAEAAGLKKTQ
jgi:hypothetical protein